MYGARSILYDPIKNKGRLIAMFKTIFQMRTLKKVAREELGDNIFGVSLRLDTRRNHMIVEAGDEEAVLPFITIGSYHEEVDSEGKTFNKISEVKNIHICLNSIRITAAKQNVDPVVMFRAVVGRIKDCLDNNRFPSWN